MKEESPPSLRLSDQEVGERGTAPTIVIASITGNPGFFICKRDSQVLLIGVLRKIKLVTTPGQALRAQ